MKRYGASEMRLLEWIGMNGVSVSLMDYDCILYLETDKYIVDYVEFQLFSPNLSLICNQFNENGLHLEIDNVFHSEFYVVRVDDDCYIIPVFLCGSLLEEDDFEHYLNHFKEYTLKIS